MDFDSPDVMKDFPGLYASELNKKCSNENDYSDETDKATKKDILHGKKRDKKDKERGYAALEGESSDENIKSRSPSKSKKSKSFKFTTKSKEKREKSRDKELVDKKKDKDKKTEKKYEKERGKKFKLSLDDSQDIAEVLPIFGVSLELAVDRSRCHDGVDIPLPIRECIDYVECAGMAFEGVYKVSGTKAKVSQIKKMYNHRCNVNLNDYDVPTATSLLKTFLRDLPEPIFTNDLLIRFEEAGAILNLSMRAKHLKNLVDNLPVLNRLLLSWIIVHLHNISLNERQNKMTKHNLSVTLNHTLHISSRVLHALLVHSTTLFPHTVIYKYIPPLGSGAQLPDNTQLLEIELKKQESLLTQIHNEMNNRCISKEREELLWEVQRILTQLKRKLKTVQKEKTVSLAEKCETSKVESKQTNIEEDTVDSIPFDHSELNLPSDSSSVNFQQTTSVVSESAQNEVPEGEPMPNLDNFRTEKHDSVINDGITLLTHKRNGLLQLKEELLKEMKAERQEVESMKAKCSANNHVSSCVPVVTKQEGLDDIIRLLKKENQILQIKKINLVREIIEQKELCIEMKAQLKLATNEPCMTNV